MARPKTMEEIMRVLTLLELMRLTRMELCDLMVQIANALRNYPEGSVERQNAITNLRNIARILANRELSLG
jgi:hypothetical protein